MLQIYRLVIGLIAGLGMLVFGTLALADTSAKCGSEVMSRDDTCVTTRKGVTTERSYDEQIAANRRVGMISVAGGPVVAAFCGFMLVRTLRKRRASREQVAPLPYQA